MPARGPVESHPVRVPKVQAHAELAMHANNKKMATPFILTSTIRNKKE